MSPSRLLDVEVTLEILLFVRSRIFRSLKHVSILTNHSDLIMDAIDFEDFKSFGISVEVSDNLAYYINRFMPGYRVPVTA